MVVQISKLSEEQLYENHDKFTIRKWCNQLRYFYYMRAKRGHNCEGDSFTAHFIYNGREDLIKKLKQLGVSLKCIGEEDLIFDPLKSYNIDDLDRLKYTIPGFPDLIQPNEEVVFGYNVHLCVQKNRFEIIVSGNEFNNTYEVSEADLVICLALENKFDELGWIIHKDSTIVKEPYCISKHYYPELY